MPPKKSNRKRNVSRKRKNVPKKAISFDKKVLAVIHKQVEDKEAYISGNESTLISFNSGINSAGDMLQIVPNMVRGVDVNERIGDRITLKQHTIKGYFRIVPNLAQVGQNKFANVAVRMMVLSFKSLSNYDQIATDTTLTTKLGGLLKKGGVTTGFTGLISDIQSPINREIFTVHYDKVYHIKQDYIQTAIGAVTADTLRMYNIKLKVKNKVLKFADDTSSGLIPTNYAPILCFGYCWMDGSAPDTTSTNLQVFHQSMIKYEDA